MKNELGTMGKGFNGEPFPSSKFRSVIAEYLGHNDEERAEFYRDDFQIEFYKAKFEQYKMQVDMEMARLKAQSAAEGWDKIHCDVLENGSTSKCTKPSYDELLQEVNELKKRLSNVVQGVIDCFGVVPPKPTNDVVIISEDKFNNLVKIINSNAVTSWLI